jgi:protein-disulfide isomerase
MGLMWGIDRGAGHGAGSGHDITAAPFEGGPWSDEAASVPVSSKDAMWGNRNAPVTLVMFSDYNCGFCKRVEGTIAELKQKYGPDKLRVIWKNFPLPMHTKAKPTHYAAEAVFQAKGSEAFWKFHSMAFENMREQTAENLAAWAAQAGVDKATFNKLKDDPKVKAKVEQDIALGQKAGVRGTPAFYINGVFLSGAQPIDKFTAEIDKQLKAAQAELKQGTPADKVYVKLTNANKKAIGGAEGAKGKDDPRRKGQDDKTVWKIPVSDDDPQKGPDTALVTIVEFSEFQCPFCSRVLPTMKQIMDTYKDKVRIVFKSNPLPFHKRALPASNMAREAYAQKGDKGFWDAHDLLFENQKKLEDEDLWGYAEKLGLDVTKVKAAVEGNKYGARIEQNQDLADDFNAGGTPHFFVNGRRVTGAQPFDRFKTIIDEEITKAEALLKKGVKADKIYEELLKDGKMPPPPQKKEVGEPHPDAPWKGSAGAKVVIHEFSDFECPYCGRVNPTLKQVMDNFGDQVKIVWRHNPLHFHKKAPLASEAAQEAWAQKGKEGFWAYHDKLFANQKKLERSDLETYAEELGLDMARFKKALDDHTHKAHVDFDLEASKKAGIGGTPAFVVNGYFISGAQPYPKFKKLIKRALKEAK